MNYGKVLSSLLLLLLIGGLVGCTGREDESLSRFREARQAEESRGENEAEALYRQLLTDFPETSGARQARARIDEIRKRRELAYQKASLPIMDRIKNVLEGYRSMYGSFPAALQDFDNGDFFFDSAYLADGVPQGFTAYLALGNPTDGYRIWTLPEGAEVGFSIDGGKSGLLTVPREEAMKKIGGLFEEKARKGRLVFLAPRV